MALEGRIYPVTRTSNNKAVRYYLVGQYDTELRKLIKMVYVDQRPPCKMSGYAYSALDKAKQLAATYDDPHFTNPCLPSPKNSTSAPAIN